MNFHHFRTSIGRVRELVANPIGMIITLNDKPFIAGDIMRFIAEDEGEFAGVVLYEIIGTEFGPPGVNTHVAIEMDELFTFLREE